MRSEKTEQALQMWQAWMARNEEAFEKERSLMDGREKLYEGEHKLLPLTDNDLKNGVQRKTSHVWNIVAENIEAEIDSSIPAPKVTARRKKDEKLARIVEAMLKNELDRLPMEELNDMQERTVPIQGGGLFLVEWDNTKHTHHTVGETVVSLQHPKKCIPQEGVYGGIEEMDAFGMKLTQTKEFIHRRYGVDVRDEAETDPALKSSRDLSTANDLVTQYVVYHRNKKGGIGLFSWVGDQVLADLQDYQARRLRRCKKCGEPERVGAAILNAPTIDGSYPEGAQQRPSQEGVCQICGGRVFVEEEEAFEEVYLPAQPGEIPEDADVITESGEDGIHITFVRQKIPYYKPDVYPVILQKNVSVFGKFLGDSDVDKIADQQNTLNRMEQKIIERFVRAGSVITKPASTHLPNSSEDSQVWILDSAVDKQLIDVYDFKGDLSSEMAYLDHVYEEARKILGITDSFQGRKDTTATSGKAKEFAAAQSAGRLESKRVMKNATYARLFEVLFKFRLAYCDEPRDVVMRDPKGERTYDQFNRLDFLERDEGGQWHWIDDFIFSTDTAATLAQNREAMWKETTNNLQSGAFGDPGQLETLVLYWTKMELLNYPGAGDTKQYLEQRQQAQQQMQAAMPAVDDSGYPRASVQEQVNPGLSY